MPERIQLRRTKGWRMPPNTVKVARPGNWGNPFRVGDPVGDGFHVDYYLTPEQAVREYRLWLRGHLTVFPVYRRRAPTIEEICRDLRGKNLACFYAPGQPCHADVLLEIANSSQSAVSDDSLER